MLKINQRGPSSPSKSMSVPTSFEVQLFFHALGVVSMAVNNKSLIFGQLYPSGRLIGLCVSLLTKAWCVLFQESG